jgi:hypothetical protein
MARLLKVAVKGYIVVANFQLFVIRTFLALASVTLVDCNIPFLPAFWVDSRFFGHPLTSYPSLKDVSLRLPKEPLSV